MPKLLVALLEWLPEALRAARRRRLLKQLDDALSNAKHAPLASDRQRYREQVARLREELWDAS